MDSLRVTPPFLYTAATILPVVCTAVVTLRFFVRSHQTVKYGLDDWLVLPALVLIYGMAAGIITGTALKCLGYKTPLVDPSMSLQATSYEQTVTRKLYWAITNIATVTLTFIKTSCLLFYSRIFRTGSKDVARILLPILLVLAVVWGVSFFFAFTFICGTHFDYLWTNVANEMKCSSTKMFNQSISISDVIMDFLIIIFPIPLVWQLQMPRRQKLAVTGIFLMATLALTASIGRLVIIFKELQAEFAKRSDEDFVSTAGLYFQFLECTLALCAICLPTLTGAWRLDGFQRFIDSFHSIFSTRQRSSPTLENWTESQDRFCMHLPDPQEAPYTSDNDKDGSSMELQNGKAIKVTKDIALSHSTV